MPKDILNPLRIPFGDMEFCIIKFSSPHSAILKSTLNRISRKVNLTDIHLADPLDILLATDTTV